MQKRGLNKFNLIQMRERIERDVERLNSRFKELGEKTQYELKEIK